MRCISKSPGKEKSKAETTRSKAGSASVHWAHCKLMGGVTAGLFDKGVGKAISQRLHRANSGWRAARNKPWHTLQTSPAKEACSQSGQSNGNHSNHQRLVRQRA